MCGKASVLTASAPHARAWRGMWPCAWLAYCLACRRTHIAGRCRFHLVQEQNMKCATAAQYLSYTTRRSYACAMVAPHCATLTITSILTRRPSIRSQCTMRRSCARRVSTCQWIPSIRPLCLRASRASRTCRMCVRPLPCSMSMFELRLVCSATQSGHLDAMARDRCIEAVERLACASYRCRKGIVQLIQFVPARATTTAVQHSLAQSLYSTDAFESPSAPTLVLLPV